MKRSRPEEPNIPRKQARMGHSARSASSSASASSSSSQQHRHLKVEDAMAYLEEVKRQFLNRPQVYNQFLDIMKDFKAQTIDTPGVIARVSNLFKGYRNLILGFNTFLPPGYRIELDDHDQPRSVVDPSKFEEQAPPSPPPEPQQTPQGVIDFDQAISYVTKIKSRFIDEPHKYRDFLDILHTFQQDQTTISEVYKQVEILFKDHDDLLADFAQFLPAPVKKTSRKRKKGKKERREKETESRKEASLRREREGRFGPSYKPLSKSFPRLHCSGRTELCDEVLNDDLVSVAAGSEESRDSHKKSQYDEILFQCEDDRTELDIVLEQNYSTLMYLEPLLDKLSTVEPEDLVREYIDQMRELHVASIARIYADRAPDVLEGLRKNPVITIPIIVRRLRQKDDEWRSARRELNKFWREVYEKNTQKQYDVQSSNFKQLDKKITNQKNLLKEIEERHHFNNSMVLKLGDSRIHRDLFSIIMTVCECSLEESDIEKVKSFWKEFVCPFFDLEPSFVDNPSQYKAHAAPENAVKHDEGEGSSGATPMDTDADEEAEDSSNSVNGSLSESREGSISESATSVNNEAQKEHSHYDDTAMRANEDDGNNFRAKENNVNTNNQRNNSNNVQQEEDMSHSNTNGNSNVNNKINNNEHDIDQVRDQKDNSEDDPMCLPLVEQKIESANTEGQRIFYANTTLYTFFRLYSLAIERLVKARNIAYAEENKYKSRRTAPSTVVENVQSLTETTEEKFNPMPTKKSTVPQEDASRYTQFLECLACFVDNSLDQSKFEEEVQALLGYTAYILFTMDKLVSSIMNHINTLLFDNVCQRLLNAFKYEYSRVNSFVDNSYLVHSFKILESDTCFQFKYKPKRNLMNIKIMDPPSVDKEREYAEAKGFNYVEQYMNNLPNEDQIQNKVFMKRNLRKADVLDRMVLSNGLECKICIATYKMFYVEQTEDFLFVKKVLPKTKQKHESRSKKFRSWQAQAIERIG